MRVRRTRRGAAGLICGALGLLFALAATAQPQGEPPDEQRLAELQALVTNATDLGEARQAELQTALGRAGESLKRAARERAEAQRLQATIDGSEAQIADYRRRIDDIERAPQTLRRRLGSQPSLDAIEAEVAVVQAQRNGWADERKEALAAAANAAQTTTRARERLTALSAELESAATAAAAPADGDIAAQVEQAARRARRGAQRAEKERLETALRGAPALTNLRTARIAWLDAAITEADALLEEMRASAASRRENAANQRNAETRRILAMLPEVRPELREIADRNLALIAEQQALSQRIETESRRQAQAREGRESVEQDASLMRRRLEVAGLGAKLGEVMLTRLASLPDPRILALDSGARNAEIAEASVAAIDAGQTLRERADRSSYLAGLTAGEPPWSIRERRAADLLLQQQRELLQENVQAQNRIVRLLVDSNQANAQLVEAVDEYREFLTGNLLWMRNYSYLSPARLRGQLSAVLSLDPATLRDAQPMRLLRDPYFMGGALLLLLLLLRRRIEKRKLADMLNRPIRPRDERAAMVARGLLLSVLVSLPLPLALGLAGRVLELLGSAQGVLPAAAAALQGVAWLSLVLGLLQRLSARLGAGRRLLKWNSTKVDTLRRDIVWARPALLVAVAAIVFGRTLSPTDSGGAIAAAGSAIAALALLLIALRALRSKVFAGDWLGLFGLRVSAILAAAIVVMHLSGQLFAAHMYLEALSASIVAVLGVLFALNVLQRLLLIYQGGLERRAREEAREREREARERERETGEAAVAAPAPQEAEAEADLEAVASLSEAYEQLLGVARLLALGGLLWLIWSPALPAVDVLDTITLWTTTDGSLPEGELRNITVATLLLVALVLLVTTLLTRHLPPLVNVLLLEWGSVSSGGRYATGMLMQYVIIGAGAGIALSQLGFAWSKVQWLVAALGVGIGFGLQEIVANFISGLIVLFERPIRVGDIIRAGGNDGTVSRINPRATVIETFEGKEVLVPNKELITGIVTNWSLSSTRLRVVVPVGVAYGCDVGEAMRILLGEARANAEVLEDPEPFVTFEDFGDNALVLWLRCYALGNYLGVATALRLAIYDRLAEAGIGIAFPQRDVHLDASTPIPVRMVGEDARPAPPGGESGA